VRLVPQPARTLNLSEFCYNKAAWETRADGIPYMARAGKRSGKKAAKKKEKKRKVAVSPKAPQAGTAPATAQSPMSPDFPGNIPSPQGVGASTAAAAGSAEGTGAAAALAGESSLAANATVITAYDRMLARLGELEATLAQLPPPPPPTPGIGHNNPPPVPTELEEIKRDIALLKAQPPPPPVEANNIASKFVHVAGRVFAWFGKHLDTFVTEFMKSAGKTAGATIGLSPIWLTFGHQLTDSAAAIMQWVMTRLGQ
jgi:hypothetical protein